MIAKSVVLIWLCFQIYSAWMAWHLLHRTPCTALYSPGHVGALGPILVGIFLFIESSGWVLICCLLILIINGIRGLVKKEEHFNLSLKTLLF